MPSSFTPDGRRLVVSVEARDIAALSLDGSPRIEPLLTSDAIENIAEISPDGRWIAHNSNESGRFEVYVRPFPDVNRAKWQISREGGSQPLWGRNGRELFFRAPDGAVMAVSVTLTPTFVPGTVSKVFEGSNYAGGGNVVQGRTYDVSPDDRRFIMIKVSRSVDLPAPNSVVVVQNWSEEPKARVPTR
jgi:eukaryotic-like serine/threonine-protein kinase